MEGVGWQKQRVKTFLLYCLIINVFVYLHILLFIPEQALSTSGRSLFFFMGCPPDRHPQPDNAQLSVKRQQSEQSIPHT